MVVNQSFGIANRFPPYAKNVLGFIPVDGALGLAPTAITPNNVTSFFYNIAASLDQKVLSIWLESSNNLSTQTLQSTVTLGGRDDEHCSAEKWFYTPQADPSYWSFTLDSITIGANNLNVTQTKTQTVAQKAFMYHYNFLIAGPDEHIDFIAKSIGAEEAGNYYSISCDKSVAPHISFTIGNHNITLTPDDYVLSVITFF
uniref:Peptidase A1 domain-containing protein n=1 Tax=Ditylenchus dipsaci TaxID=166011 RepID=A0A915E5F0_9BILA